MLADLCGKLHLWHSMSLFSTAAAHRQASSSPGAAEFPFTVGYHRWQFQTKSSCSDEGFWSSSVLGDWRRPHSTPSQFAHFSRFFSGAFFFFFFFAPLHPVPVPVVAQFWNKSPCRHRPRQKKARWWSFKDSSSTEMGMRIMGERKFKLRLSRFFYLLTRAAPLDWKVGSHFPSALGLWSGRINGSNRLCSICHDSRLSCDSVQYFE